jgi:hypothetical protein
VDFYLSETRDREAAKIFLKRAIANPDIAISPTYSIRSVIRRVPIARCPWRITNFAFVRGFFDLLIPLPECAISLFYSFI